MEIPNDSRLIHKRLAQAKTGTGKTLAFLVPIFQNILREDPSLLVGRQTRSSSRFGGGSKYGGAQSDDIRAVIISPTRELAEQIAAEARKVVRNTGLKVQTAVGGTRKMEGLRRIQNEGCHVLVGTPGRLIDIFSDPRSGVKAPRLNALVLDEADRLLDAGFAPAIQEIQSFFPKANDRQTLMFSATVAPEIMNMVRRTMKRDFAFIKTIKEDEVPTHLAVPQKAVFLNSLPNQMPAVVEIAKQAIDKHQSDPTNNRPFKAIVYYNSTSEVTLAQQAFNKLRENPKDPFSPNPLNIQSMEMHSRLTQAQRTRNSDAFRRAKSAILFSSDVTARGMDFPNVTHVIQVGVPQDRESYIHRLGRTARANKTGEGWLLITKPENRDLRLKLRGLPIQEDNISLQTARANMAMSALNESEGDILTQVRAAFSEVDFDFKEKAYIASLNLASQSREKFRELNEMTKILWNLPEPPAISYRLAEKLNISRNPDVNIATGYSRASSMFGSESNPRDSRIASMYGNGFNSGAGRQSFGRDRSGGNDDFGSRKIFDFKHHQAPRRDGGRGFGGQRRDSRGGPFGRFNRDSRR